MHNTAGRLELKIYYRSFHSIVTDLLSSVCYLLMSLHVAYMTYAWFYELGMLLTVVIVQVVTYLREISGVFFRTLATLLILEITIPGMTRKRLYD
jgi:hypothetical protein